MTAIRDRLSMWTAMVMAAALFAATMPAQAEVDLPASAVADDTFLALWLDGAELTPDAVRGAVERVNAVLPEEMRQTREQLDAQLNEGLEEFGEAHEAFMGAGGEGMLMLLRGGEGNGEAMPDPTVLIRVEPGTDADAFTAAMRDAADEDAEDVPDLLQYADRWLAPADMPDAAPVEGDADHARRLEQLFGRMDAAPVRLVFWMTPTLREQIEQAHDEAAGQQQGMMMNPGVQLLGPMRRIEAGWATLTLGEDLAIRPVLQFESDQDAEEYRSLWEQMLTFGQQMFQMQLAQMPEPPDQQAVQGLFQSLRLERDGRELSGEIGDAFLTHLGGIAPALEPMIMQMLMLRGMGQQQQGAEPPMLPPGEQPQGPPPPPQ